MKVLGVQRPGTADLLTLANIGCGALAVLLAVDRLGGGQPITVTDVRPLALLLVAGTLFDVLDGLVARRGGGTALGPQLDTLADSITFGVAPAVVVAVIGLGTATTAQQLAIAAAFVVYCLAAQLRLADFTALRHGAPQFTGLPSPMAAVLLIDLALWLPSPWIAAAGIAVTGALMVVDVEYPCARGATLGVAGFGWAIGLAGLCGLIEVRIPATISAAVILGLLPLTARLGSRAAEELAPA